MKARERESVCVFMIHKEKQRDREFNRSMWTDRERERKEEMKRYDDDAICLRGACLHRYPQLSLSPNTFTYDTHRERERERHFVCFSFCRFKGEERNTHRERERERERNVNAFSFFFYFLFFFSYFFLLDRFHEIDVSINTNREYEEWTT